jgi:hypothetical protein
MVTVLTLSVKVDVGTGREARLAHGPGTAGATLAGPEWGRDGAGPSSGRAARPSWHNVG